MATIAGEALVVAQVAFTEWTEGGSLRHAQFLALRRQVRRRVGTKADAKQKERIRRGIAFRLVHNIPTEIWARAGTPGPHREGASTPVSQARGLCRGGYRPPIAEARARSSPLDPTCSRNRVIPALPRIAVSV